MELTIDSKSSFRPKKGRPHDPSKAASVASLLLEVVPLAMRELRRELKKSDCGDLTIAQFRILAHLWVEPANNKTLAEALGVSVPATSRMVKLLAQRRYVESTQCLTDKREVSVRLTKGGLRRFELARESMRNRLTDRLQYLPRTELEAAELGFQKLKSVVSGLQTLSDFTRN